MFLARRDSACEFLSDARIREIELIGISTDIVRSGDEGIVLYVWLEVIEAGETVGEIVEALPF